MKLENKYIDELICIRKSAREKRDWALADRIRAYLDSKHTFVFDTREGQVVYHDTTKTRKELVASIKRSDRSEKMFNAYLTTIKSFNKLFPQQKKCY